VAPGRDATFDLAAVHEVSIPVECYLVVFTQKGRTTTTWVKDEHQPVVVDLPLADHGVG
jgi:hypothetical protein